MSQEKVEGSLQEMVAWMKDNNVNENQINAFEAEINGHGGDRVGIMEMAKNCTRTTERKTGDGETGICTTITCCTTFDNGEEICGSTTHCT